MQDAEIKDSISYASIDDVPGMDLITDWDTLTADYGVLTASVKNSLAYTFKYT